MFSDIVTGVSARREDIDRGISVVLTPDWPLDRLEIILRAILCAGAYELLAVPKVPTRVVISEYLDIAHAFFEGQGAGIGERRARPLRRGSYVRKALRMTKRQRRHVSVSSSASRASSRRWLGPGALDLQ